MHCEICNWQAESTTWVRPKSGGTRRPHFFCDDECKKVGLQVLAAQGLEETTVILGWDVFIPIWSRE
ncbi:MAG: hypothetical protein HYS26_04015 [Candidatus Kaiserbacteria bacterium]|nr:MAG: hypothetical protein HYS26_04015 [Candidatus Kaiserbacteria bacterium]